MTYRKMSIYVKGTDVPLFEEARKKFGSVSSVLAECLREKLHEPPMRRREHIQAACDFLHDSRKGPLGQLLYGQDREQLSVTYAQLAALLWVLQKGSNFEDRLGAMLRTSDRFVQSAED